MQCATTQQSKVWSSKYMSTVDENDLLLDKGKVVIQAQDSVCGKENEQVGTPRRTWSQLPLEGFCNLAALICISCEINYNRLLRRFGRCLLNIMLKHMEM